MLGASVRQHVSWAGSCTKRGAGTDHGKHPADLGYGNGKTRTKSASYLSIAACALGDGTCHSISFSFRTTTSPDNAAPAADYIECLAMCSFQH
jgi:hypothetical protein